MLITDRCSMRISDRSCRNMQQSIRSFMKMTWISILIPKSVQTSNFPDSKNGRSRRDRIKNIIWPERCTAGQVKSAMWAATAKVRHCSSACGIGLKPHTVGENHHTDRGQLHYPQKPGNTALAEGEPEVQGHYSPWMNHVERLWQALNDTITRNHQCRSMWQL